MRSALERRQEILEALSDRRFETVQNLATEFGVSVRTIKYDLEYLACSAPIYTVQGNGGGVRVADGWYVGRRYLHNDQEALLRELMDGLQPDQQRIMQSIYDQISSAAEEYGMPDNYMAGANIASFLKISEAMLAQGVC